MKAVLTIVFVPLVLILYASSSSAEIGACCTPDGTCITTAEAHCSVLNGTYLGDNTSCLPNPCASQACCHEDGTCTFVTADGCADGDGIPQGPGTVCDPNPCVPPPPTGACCTGENFTQCVMLAAEGCSALEGIYHGDGTTCDPDPCVTSLKKATWGQIKAGYQ